MDAVLRATGIYVVLLVLLHLTGKRGLSQMNAFDLVLLMIVSEATGQGMLGDDHSMTNSLLVITTLVGINIVLSTLRQRSDRVDRPRAAQP